MQPVNYSASNNETTLLIGISLYGSYGLSDSAHVPINSTSAPNNEVDAARLAEDSIIALKNVTTGYVIPVIYSILFLFGIVGNSMVIYFTFIKDGTSDNPINIYIGNLAVADLVLIMTVPCWGLTHVLKGNWIFGDVGCKVMSFLLHVNMYSSIFFITAMAIDRYHIMTGAAVRRRDKPQSRHRIIIDCGIIWFISCGLSVPSLILRKTLSSRRHLKFCSWEYPNGTSTLWWIEHAVARNLVAFVIPLMIISFCYLNIVVKVKQHSVKNRAVGASGHKRVRHITRTVAVFVIAFVICWLPNQVSNFLQLMWHFRFVDRPRSKYDEDLAYLAHLFTTILSFSNSILNPLIYSANRNKKSLFKIFTESVTKCFSTRIRRRTGTISNRS